MQCRRHTLPTPAAIGKLLALPPEWKLQLRAKGAPHLCYEKCPIYKQDRIRYCHASTAQSIHWEAWRRPMHDAVLVRYRPSAVRDRQSHSPFTFGAFWATQQRCSSLDEVLQRCMYLGGIAY